MTCGACVSTQARDICPACLLSLSAHDTLTAGSLCVLTVLADSLPAGCTKGSAASCPREGAEKASKRNLLMVSWFLLEDGAHGGVACTTRVYVSV